MDILEFQDLLFNHMLTTMKGSEKYTYSDSDLKKVNELRDSKFSTWEWNYGYSPGYEYNKSIRFGDGAVFIHMNVDKGIIQEVDIEGEFMGVKSIRGLEDALVGTIHDPETLRLRLSGILVSDYINGMDNEKFLSGMF